MVDSQAQRSRSSASAEALAARGFFSAREPAQLRRLLRGVFVLLVLVVAGLMIGAYFIARDLDRSSQHEFVDVVIPIRAATRDLLLQMVNEETGTRGFLITGRDASLAPLIEGRAASAKDVAALEDAASSDPTLARLLASAVSYRALLERFFRTEVAVARTGPAGVERARARVNLGERTFDRFRASAQDLLAHASDRTVQAQKHEDHVFHALTALLAALGGLAVLLLALLAWRVPRRAYFLVARQQQLLLAEQRATAELSTRRQFALRLSRADDVAGVVSALAAEAEALFGTSSVSVGLLEGESPSFRVLEHPFSGPPGGEGVAPEALLPGPASVRRRAAVFYESGPAIEAEFPEAVEPGAGAFLPLIAQDGGIVGYLAVRYPGERSFEPGDREDLRILASQVGQAFERARTHERQRDAALTLQNGLLPPLLPSPNGIELVGRYLAAGDGINVGGDWYDAVLRPDGTVCVSVGDVVGHGISAAILMGRLSHSFRAYALEQQSPAEILRHLCRHVEEDDMATAICVEIDPGSRTLTYSVAGHPPGLLLDAASGSLTRLDEQRSPPLGFADPAGFRQCTVPLPESGLLVLYTDGLVERRGADLGARIGELEASLLSLAGTEPEVAATELTARLAGDERQLDDIVLLLGKISPASAGEQA